MYVDAHCIDTASLSRRDPCADSSRPARYSMLATTPASNPNWCVPTSSRAGPVAYGFSDTELNELIIDGSRKTSAPIGGPPHTIAFTATTSASISSMSINRYGAPAEGPPTTHPPPSCTSFVTARRSVTAPNVEEAEAIAANRVDRVIRPSHCQVGSSPLSMSTSAHFTLAP